MVRRCASAVSNHEAPDAAISGQRKYLNSFPSPLVGEGARAKRRAEEGLPHRESQRPLSRLEFASLIRATLSREGRGERGVAIFARRGDETFSPTMR
jgi:hypothetical protein